MEVPFKLDKFHFNNHLGASVLGDRFSGFSLDDQSKTVCLCSTRSCSRRSSCRSCSA